MALEIAKNFFFLERGWLNANHFVLTGPEPEMIDAAYKSGLDETRELLSELGVEFEAVKRIILTHTHCDHVGAVPAVAEASGCRVMLDAVSAHFIRHRNSLGTWWSYYDQEADFFEVHDELHPGQEIAFGGMTLQVIAAPGHASGQICLFEPRERFLISADALWEKGLGVLTPRIEGLDSAFRAMRTLGRIEAVKPRVIYPGHGAAIENPTEALAAARARLTEFIDEPRIQGVDQIKKIIIYTLLMREGMPAATLFNNLTEMPWFGETMALFFSRERPRRVFDDVVDELITKESLQADGPFLTATVRA